jgi:hypothetical protein
MPDVERHGRGPLRVSGRYQFDQLRVQLDGRVPVPAEAQPLGAAYEGIELLEHGLESMVAQRGDRDPVDLLVGVQCRADVTRIQRRGEAAFLRDSQVPINMAVFATPVRNAAWRDKPSWAVIATEDRAFDQAMLQHMAKRIAANITNVPASHAVYVTQSAVVSDVIVTAARDAAGGAR